MVGVGFTLLVKCRSPCESSRDVSAHRRLLTGAACSGWGVGPALGEKDKGGVDVCPSVHTAVTRVPGLTF